MKNLIILWIALAVSPACSMKPRSLFLTPVKRSKYFTTSGNIFSFLWLEASVSIEKMLDASTHR
jgi:hypothetical protein